MSMLAPTPAEVRLAAQRIRGVAKRTPVMTSRSLNEATGLECHVKCENFQTSGSFKIRGATNFLRQIPEADRTKGVVAVSSGNHAQAVAIAAQILNMKATICMPDDAPQNKLQATRDRGAEIVVFNRATQDRDIVVREVQERTGATLVHPFDHPWIMAGQGTAALELLEDHPDLDSLFVCLGGGGLLSGSAIIAKSINPKIKVYGVEPELANDFYLSFKSGQRKRVDNSPTIADGLRTPIPGALTFEVVRELVDDVILVSEAEIRAAMRFLMMRLKIVAEPSGAVTTAAALAGKLPPNAKRAGFLLSGGNVDLDVFCQA